MLTIYNFGLGRRGINMSERPKLGQRRRPTEQVCCVTH